jgi:CheY-like chemotaxis protein/DNA-directed RNA polymerase specialized sigma24 family protein
MSISQQVVPHLPYLRRFARILTGRQESGDAYVAGVLEAIIADPSCFDRNLPPRNALYRLFLDVWNSVALNGDHAPDKVDLPVGEARLQAITPLPRQAFLLATVEGFTPDEVAELLGITAPDARLLLEKAGQEIAAEVATSILIIEDEPLIALDLEDLAESLGHRVVTVARTRDAAVKAFHTFRPGLVLADVQLADGSSGLDAVKDIISTQEVPVIFITAYPEQVLTGLRPEPTFLIPKPFHSEVLKAVISQALFFDIKAHRAAA